jgi:hypothetical protein
VTPDIPAEGNFNLIAFHQFEHRRYVLAANGVYGLLVASVVALGLVALFVSARWAQIVSAASIAALHTGYMIITTRVAG